jgi:hypothetical protein
MTKQDLLNQLIGVDESANNGFLGIRIHPCSGCDCGSILCALYLGKDQVPSVYLDLNNPTGLSIVTQTYNYLNDHQPPMTEKNFLQLLVNIFVEELVD